jgi:hypothetical protein
MEALLPVFGRMIRASGACTVGASDDAPHVIEGEKVSRIRSEERGVERMGSFSA